MGMLGGALLVSPTKASRSFYRIESLRKISVGSPLKKNQREIPFVPNKETAVKDLSELGKIANGTGPFPLSRHFGSHASQREEAAAPRCASNGTNLVNRNSFSKP